MGWSCKDSQIRCFPPPIIVDFHVVPLRAKAVYLFSLCMAHHTTMMVRSIGISLSSDAKAHLPINATGFSDSPSPYVSAAMLTLLSKSGYRHYGSLTLEVEICQSRNTNVIIVFNDAVHKHVHHTSPLAPSKALIGALRCL